MQEMNKIVSLVNESEIAQAVIFCLKERKRNTLIADLDKIRIKTIKKLNRSINWVEYTKFWKKLQELNVGEIYYDSRGRASKFKWNYPVVDLVKSIIDTPSVLIQRNSPQTIKRNVNTLVFASGKTVDIISDQDISQEQIDKITEVLYH